MKKAFYGMFALFACIPRFLLGTQMSGGGPSQFLYTLDKLHMLSAYIVPILLLYVGYMIDKHIFRSLSYVSRKQSAYAAGFISFILAGLSYSVTYYFLGYSLSQSVQYVSSLELLLYYMYTHGAALSMLVGLSLGILICKMICMHIFRIDQGKSVLWLGGIALGTRGLQLVAAYYGLLYMPALAFGVMPALPVAVLGVGLLGLLVCLDLILSKIV